jgi:ribosomal subunit interface protein
VYTEGEATEQGEIHGVSVRVHFQDVRHSERLRRDCEESVNGLQQEFPETSKFEVTLTHTGDTHETHVHVTGKDLEIASSGQALTLEESMTDALEKIRKQLRKHRDKLIFGRRRNANKRS